jgi:hypothetical protein
MTSHGRPEPIPAPWVLIDDLTVDQTADLLQRLTSWLTGPDTEATGHFPAARRALQARRRRKPALHPATHSRLA